MKTTHTDITLFRRNRLLFGLVAALMLVGLVWWAALNVHGTDGVPQWRAYLMFALLVLIGAVLGVSSVAAFVMHRLSQAAAAEQRQVADGVVDGE